jgi:methionyl-tRNA formyltransferase
VSIAAPQIFKKSLLESVPHGCINSHSALLPENRGMMPVFWAMFKGLPQTGVTIHYMDARLDSGDIIAVEKVQIQNESLHEMILKTKRISARMIDETLRNIMNGTVSRISMPSGGSSQTFPSPDSVKEFRRRGRRLF